MPPERTYSPLTQLITLVMRIGRKCPEVQGDMLEIMLLVSQIQAHVGIDHGYRHARRVIARLRHPLWDDLTPEELAVSTRPRTRSSAPASSRTATSTSRATASPRCRRASPCSEPCTGDSAASSPRRRSPASPTP
jgi:hypothetical protein